MARFNVLAYIDELMDMGMSEEDAYNECDARIRAEAYAEEQDKADEEYRQWLEEQEAEEYRRYEEAQEEHERYEAEAERELEEKLYARQRQAEEDYLSRACNYHNPYDEH